MINLSPLILGILALATFVRILAFIGSHHKQLCKSTMRRYELYKVLIGAAVVVLLQGLSFLMIVPIITLRVQPADPLVLIYASAGMLLYIINKLIQSLELFFGRNRRARNA